MGVAFPYKTIYFSTYVADPPFFPTTGHHVLDHTRIPGYGIGQLHVAHNKNRIFMLGS